MLIASSLVLLMIVPGLALFYGGMGRSTSVLNSMMMSFTALGVLGVKFSAWLLFLPIWATLAYFPLAHQV
ncbi:MAG: hypothetical protein ACRCYU_21185 [Nocardioides sp.]